MDGELAVDHVKALPSVMTSGTRVHSDLDDSVCGVPLVVIIRSRPPVTHKRSVRAAVYIHMDRIFLRRIEIIRIDDHSRKSESVRGSHMDKAAERIFRSVIVRSLHICHYKSLKPMTFLWCRLRASEVCRLNVTAMSFRGHAP